MAAAVCPASTTMQIVCDNDFALFVGNSSSVTRLIYQNNVSWYNQVAALSSFTFDLQAGETTLYLVGMGGGAPEDIAGRINGVDITSIASSTLQSSDISSYLKGYSSGAVANGDYSVNLADVQLALSSGSLGWITPTVVKDENANGSYQVGVHSMGSEYSFANSTAVIFTFAVGTVGLPEPSVSLLLLAGVGLIGGFRFYRSRRTT
jgi:hypothetical protein